MPSLSLLVGFSRLPLGRLGLSAAGLAALLLPACGGGDGTDGPPATGAPTLNSTGGLPGTPTPTDTMPPFQVGTPSTEPPAASPTAAPGPTATPVVQQTARFEATLVDAQWQPQASRPTLTITFLIRNTAAEELDGASFFLRTADEQGRAGVTGTNRIPRVQPGDTYRGTQNFDFAQAPRTVKLEVTYLRGAGPPHTATFVIAGPGSG